MDLVPVFMIIDQLNIFTILFINLHLTATLFGNESLLLWKTMIIRNINNIPMAHYIISLYFSPLAIIIIRRNCFRPYISN